MVYSQKKGGCLAFRLRVDDGLRSEHMGGIEFVLPPLDDLIGVQSC